ncbi:MAG: hypothetical protein EHM67_10065 [Hyphomicrobiaceae bacterium]|nr:MAG: hypothetical protein EHM67_10065 [Hyphomicrobiaceae bacterium]
MIPDATENLRSSLKRLYRPELAKQCGVIDEKLKNFIDGGYLSDEDKDLLTSHLFPYLVFDAARDRFVSRTVTYAIMQATAYLRRRTQDCRDKQDLARQMKINLVTLEAFAEGDNDLSVAQKQDLARFFDLHNRKYDAKTDSLAPLPATSPPLITPPEVAAIPWRERQVPTLTTVEEDVA